MRDRQETRVDAPLFIERAVVCDGGCGVDVVAAAGFVLEELAVWFVQEGEDGVAQDLAEEHAADAFLEHLNAGVGGQSVEGVVVGRDG